MESGIQSSISGPFYGLRNGHVFDPPRETIIVAITSSISIIAIIRICNILWKAMKYYLGYSSHFFLKIVPPT